MADVIRGEPEAPAPLRWIPCQRVEGDGATRITLCPPGELPGLLSTGAGAPHRLRLGAPPGRWLLSHPDQVLAAPSGEAGPAGVGLWRCRLRPAGSPPGLATAADPAAAAMPQPDREALICEPLPLSAAAPPALAHLELLTAAAPPLPEGPLELGIDPRCCRLLDPRQLRGRLLEFLKFRVLAAQESFFRSFLDAASAAAARPTAAPAAWDGSAAAIPPEAIAAFRAWLAPLWPDAGHLSEADLRLCLEQAHRLYVN